MFEQLNDDQLLARVRERGGIPRHVAVIMDGNGRWARKRLLPRVAGHRAGRQAVRRTVRTCARLGVEVLTLYTFSQENWKRPAEEVRALWLFLQETLAAELQELQRNDVRLRASGELEIMPAPVQRSLAEAIAALAGNGGLVVNLALAYGGRTEILRAARRLARLAAAGELDPERIDEAAFRAGLYSPDLPDPDLVIRTSGEMRLSNFLTWQTAYSEFHVTGVLWPDFRERDLLLAVAEYQGRERRYGAVPEPDLAAERPASASGSLDPSFWRRLLKGRP